MRKRLFPLLAILLVLTFALLSFACTTPIEDINPPPASPEEPPPVPPTDAESEPSGDESIDGEENTNGDEATNDDENGDKIIDSENDGVTPHTVTEHRFTSGSVTMGYLLYTPQSATEGMPLIVYLHGGSGKGSDLALLTAGDGFPQYLCNGRLGNLPAYVLIPQLPQSYTGWENVTEALLALIGQVTSSCHINAQNISLTGHSMGGTGVWSIAAASPATFARIAPLSGSVRSAQDKLKPLVSMPIYTFVGSADTVVDPASTKNFVSALQNRNNSVTLVTLEGATHFDVPALAYLSDTYGLINWLIDA